MPSFGVSRVLEAARLPPPVQQFEVKAGAPHVLPRLRVAGLQWSSPSGTGCVALGTPSAVAYDNARLTELSAAGWRPLVFTDETSDAEIVERTRDLPPTLGDRPPTRCIGID